ncbi:zinc finger BED domain-containing protein 1-like [Acyrthosiphon pisum]|uniref:Zinc finger BED domain-containing protein 1-like n=1 Tax=Acyrthosiphon pisum TaxID=7029 RepID=A0A8R2A8F5_ACYPI|nr:zinc finger BED domain-containing protein 1-like [Acyrthosiphon pisum]|eukprot:XP_003241803.1 PREDICTED: zinc finger BED domain-containing protein 1-like [Acyrthosiphon pisum]
MPTTGSDHEDDPIPETHYADLANEIVSKANNMQTTLINVSRSSSSSSFNLKNVDSDNDSAIRSKPSCSSGSSSSSLGSAASASAYSLNSQKLKQPKIVESLSDIRSYEQGGSKTIAITDALIYMLAKDNLPLSTTEKPGFVHFMRKAAPMYKVPSRKIVTKLVQSKYEVLSSLVKSKLSNIEYITITADIWTDIINTTSFLGMTAHFLNNSKLDLESITIGVLELADNHTSDHISEWFEKQLNEWGIQKDKVVNVVTDSGSNIKSAVKKTFNTSGVDKHLPCFAHTLNLVTQRSLNDLEDVQNIISKIKGIVTFFKHSVNASDELRKLCDYKLKQSVPTRWNSVYYMIDRFVLCSTHIASVLINSRQGPSMLSAMEIDIAKEINCMLKPFEVATKELRGEQYITGSKVIPLIHYLIKKCEQVNLINPIA